MIVQLLLCGLEGSGKSTLIKSYQAGEFKLASPFTFQKITDLDFKNRIYRLIEVGGRQEVRHRVYDFVKDARGIIFVVDGSSDDKKFEEATHEVNQLISHPESIGKPFIILFNKVDISQRQPAEFIDELQLLDRFDRPHQVFKTTAKQPQVFDDVLDWIHLTLKEENRLLQDKDTRLISMGILDLLNEKKQGLPLLAILGQLEILSRAGQIKYDRDKIIATLRMLKTKGEISFDGELHIWKITETGKQRLEHPDDLVKGDKYEKLQALLQDEASQEKKDDQVLDEFQLDELAELYDKKSTNENDSW